MAKITITINDIPGAGEYRSSQNIDIAVRILAAVIIELYPESYSS